TPVNNWDKSYYGYLTIQASNMYSRNVPAVKSLEAVGLTNALKFLNGLGIDYPEMFYSNAISSATNVSNIKYGASSEKMAAAYAAFSNGGIYYKPQYVNKIIFSDDTETTYQAEGHQAMKATT
ncbi:penicillin-binding protein, partial [Enterococcus faecalis]|nr:penicillin-binding protein [Enterococcus faecalis]